MNIEEFRRYGKEMVDFICEFRENISERPVYPDVEPGYLKKLLPEEAPEESEPWPNILKDTNEHIIKGITHWQHPQFFSYFPHGASFPSLLGDMMSDALGVVPFSWTASPACCELEVIMMDWMCKAMGLPDHFLSTGKGGGSFQTTSSDGILSCMIAARSAGIKKLKNSASDVHDSVFLPNLIAYCSEECHSCVEKGLKLTLVKIRILAGDRDGVLRGNTFKDAIKEDIAKGLTPIFLCATFGTTSSTVVDRFDELGVLCKKYKIWFHIDAAYCGTALICPEVRDSALGIEYATSFSTNANKWFLVNTDCSLLWVKNKKEYCSSFIINPVYLEAGETDLTYDLRHWGIPLSRRFRSIKLWYVIRSFGLAGLRAYHRNHITLAKYFENLVLQDKRFEICNNVRFGLVCFKLANSTNKLNQELLVKLNETRKIFMVPTELKGIYVIRFCVDSQHATKSDIDTAFTLIQQHATKLLEEAKQPLKNSDEYRSSKDINNRLSFIKEVSKEDYDNSKRHQSLKDWATPILMIKEDTE